MSRDGGVPVASLRQLRRHLVILVALVSCGCGTMANLDGRSRPLLDRINQEAPRPFGGVRKDFQWLKSIKVPANLIFLADVPFSLVGDVVTLPRTLKRRQERSQSRISQTHQPE